MAYKPFIRPTLSKKPSNSKKRSLSLTDKFCLPITKSTTPESFIITDHNNLLTAEIEATLAIERILNNSPIIAFVPGREITYEQAEVQLLKWEILRKKWHSSKKKSVPQKYPKLSKHYS